MPLNAMYRVCGDGPMFDSYEDAEAYAHTSYGGTTWIDAMAWCCDCQDWVEEGRMDHCPDCGATWYDEAGVCGFRGGMGKQAWSLHKAQVQRDLEALAAWNAGKPIQGKHPAGYYTIKG